MSIYSTGENRVKAIDEKGSSIRFFRVGNWKPMIRSDCMFSRVVFLIFAIGINVSNSVAGIVERAQNTELQLYSGAVKTRVVRDSQGQVIRLDLSGMLLTQDDFHEIGKLEHLKSLVLRKTNVTDGDLNHLTGCKGLEHLNLTNTEVTDDAIDRLLTLRSLVSLCLGDVRVSAQAVETLKMRYKKIADRPLSLGYTPRKSD